MKRIFKVGERVWYNDDHESGWGVISLINRQDSIKEEICSDYNGDIILITKDSGSEIETTPSCIWQLAPGRTFKGSPVVWEHNEEIDYPFFCPEENENCFHCELD